MTTTGTATLQRSADGEFVAASGDWTLAGAPALGALVADLRRRVSRGVRIDAAGIGRIDTAGAELLLDLADGGEVGGLDANRRALLDAVAKVRHAPVSMPPRRPSLIALFERTGRAAEQVWLNAYRLLGFIGLILVTLVRTVPDPRRWRPTALAFHLEQAGLNAVPIVVLLNFLIGAVVAFLGATVLKDFGATIFTVELIGFSFLREFGVLLTAILIAGRSGSAFTAQIGSMKSREEVDAIRTLGLDPIEVLVLPRLLALLIALPLLTVLAMLAGIVGGAVVGAFALDISSTLFITRLQDLGAVKHFWVGISKAPLFAFLIAAIGCLEGFKVSGSAESVGTHTTSSVVQAIFVSIMVDAMAAIFFMEIGI
ncbi:ABC transporter permease [Dokdonella sp.]|uniref:ABC transporter permease n=1 Tax=Dokdonella sp. TaxID=2291710 RepID=UPI001B029239|nr:ABC transporter permease [Dokdonella sp.]MBO9664725.1 MlaE family lipid ABC transporter permease subunit [Dokdonella sp.]